MTHQPQFPTLEIMDSSEWLQDVKERMSQDIWPTECERCMETEQLNGTSIRLNAIKFDRLQKQSDYLIVGGVLDNICNSACLTCDEQHSTLIGGLTSKVYTIVDNSDKFWQLPLDRVVHLDISGGEPSYSKNYKYILANLPKNIKSVRLNTNCTTVLEELWELCSQGVHVTVTVSLDGIGPVHDFVRWPVKWDKFYNNLQRYMEMPVTLNTWTTVSALNVDDLPNILEFVKQHNLDHSYAFLKEPVELTVKNKDTPESVAYIQDLKKIRGIS
jgi:sulfatase maturation enzyme AslB (radical SAM superfamily)